MKRNRHHSEWNLFPTFFLLFASLTFLSFTLSHFLCVFVTVSFSLSLFFLFPLFLFGLLVLRLSESPELCVNCRGLERSQGRFRTSRVETIKRSDAGRGVNGKHRTHNDCSIKVQKRSTGNCFATWLTCLFPFLLCFFYTSVMKKQNWRYAFWQQILVEFGGNSLQPISVAAHPFLVSLFLIFMDRLPKSPGRQLYLY